MISKTKVYIYYKIYYFSCWYNFISHIGGSDVSLSFPEEDFACKY